MSLDPLFAFFPAEPPPRAASGALHKQLATFNRRRLLAAVPREGWQDEIASELRMRLREGEFVEQERAAVAEAAAQAPTDPEGFLAWFTDQARRGGGPRGWAASSELRFDDLIAMTRVKLPRRARLALAHRAYANELHAAQSAPEGASTAASAGGAWETVAVENLLLALAANPRYAYHSLGALVIVEAGVDAADDWLRELLEPLVREVPDAVRAIAEGALMLLAARARCEQADAA